jgi:hypothetical protein
MKAGKSFHVVRNHPPASDDPLRRDRQPLPPATRHGDVRARSEFGSTTPHRWPPPASTSLSENWKFLNASLFREFVGNEYRPRLRGENGDASQKKIAIAHRDRKRWRRLKKRMDGLTDREGGVESSRGNVKLAMKG